MILRKFVRPKNTLKSILCNYKSVHVLIMETTPYISLVLAQLVW